MANGSNYFENNFITYHPKSLLDLSDGTLRTEDGCSFPIHKVMVARSSNFLCSLISNTKDEEDILVPGIRGEDLSNILSYLYTGNIHVTEENIFDLIAASGHLQLQDLLRELSQHLRKNLTLANGLSVFKISLALKLDDLIKESFRFVQTNFESIVRLENPEIPQLPLEVLKTLLRDKNLRITSESTVWLSIAKWVEFDSPNRLPSVPDLLKHLAISDVDENLAKEILQHDIVANNPCCREINRGSSPDISDAENLLTLQRYFQTHVNALCDHRQPSMLNLLICYNVNILIYVSYDENLDLWRKLVEIPRDFGEVLRSQFLLTVNNCIYMFRNDNIRYYSFIEKQWNQLVSFRTRRRMQLVVKVGGLMYLFGGYSDVFGVNEEVDDVEVYDFETGEFRSTTPMVVPVVPTFQAVAINNVIYTLGYRGGDDEGGGEMVAQAFDTTTETWSVLPSPFYFRMCYKMIGYRGMIYVMGGFLEFGLEDLDRYTLRDVEVFDPIKNEWSIEASLPQEYSLTAATVLNDKLIVYERDRLLPLALIPLPVQWNVHQRCWETLEDSSMKDLNNCEFQSIESRESISVISRESKDPATVFECNPFPPKS